MERFTLHDLTEKKIRCKIAKLPKSTKLRCRIVQFKRFGAGVNGHVKGEKEDGIALDTRCLCYR